MFVLTFCWRVGWTTWLCVFFVVVFFFLLRLWVWLEYMWVWWCNLRHWGLFRMHAWLHWRLFRCLMCKRFLSLVDEHFPTDHELRQICNRNTLKISYSTMDSMEKAIKAHNQRVQQRDHTEQKATCNCRVKNNCPLGGKCLTENVIYKATVTTQEDTKTYIGLTSNTFKTRFTQHKASFNDKKKINHTELSKYIWTLKDNDTTYNINWQIIQRAQPYSPKSKRCNLCLWEKYHIITANNKISALNSCRHRKKHLLSEFRWHRHLLYLLTHLICSQLYSRKCSET